VGSTALVTNSTGNGNTAIGATTLTTNTTGFINTAVGIYGLVSNTTGSENTAVGGAALFHNTTGNQNTANGDGALITNVSGSRNTAIGYSADVISDALVNTTVIGYNAKVAASNTVQIGNTAVTDVYIGDPNTTILHAASVNTTSDARFKYDIKSNVPGLDFITQLNPVTYYLDDEKLAEFTKTGVLNNGMFKRADYMGMKQLHTGFLAQDVEKITQTLGYNFDGLHIPSSNKDHYSLSYASFVVPLVKAVQEQQQQIDELKKENEELKKVKDELEDLKKTVEKLSANK
jgi:hypothetical protein